MRTRKEAIKESNCSAATYAKRFEAWKRRKGYQELPTYLIVGTGIYKSYPVLREVKEETRKQRKS